MKATEVIKRDHRAVEEMFAKFEKASSEERAEMEPAFFDSLAIHEKMEDTYFYPAIKDRLSDTAVLDALEFEQKELEIETAAMRAMVGVRGKALLAAMNKILDHAKKEEQELFPQVESVLSEEELEELGAQMEPESATAKA